MEGKALMGVIIRGHEDVLKIFKEEIPRKTPELKKKTLQAFAERFLFLLNQFAPRDTGEYAGAWEILELTDTYVKIGILEGRTHTSGIDMDDLFVILEFGVNHPIEVEAVNAKALHFTFHGDKVFTMRVVIPPRPPQPHARTAFDDVVREIPDIATRVLMEVFPYLRKV